MAKSLVQRQSRCTELGADNTSGKPTGRSAAGNRLCFSSVRLCIASKYTKDQLIRDKYQYHFVWRGVVRAIALCLYCLNNKAEAGMRSPKNSKTGIGEDILATNIRCQRFKIKVVKGLLITSKSDYQC